MHIVTLAVLLRSGLTFSFSVAIESHPPALLSVSLYVPATVIKRPFHEYGNWFGQIVRVDVFETTGLTVNSKMAIESHPDVLFSVSE